MALVAPQPQRPIPLTEGTKDSPIPTLSHPQPQAVVGSVSWNGATTSSSDGSISSYSPDVLGSIPPPSQHFVLTREEVMMLSAHGLAHFDLLDDRVWETSAFELWLQYRTPLSSIMTDGHRNKLAPLAVRALRPATQQGMPWQFEWTSLFRAYTIITDRAVQRETMYAIVYVEEDWVRDGGLALLGLAWMCVERVVEGDEVVRESVGRLAMGLFKIFASRRVVYANVFMELLKRCIWEEFEAWWTQGQGLSSAPYRESLPALGAAYGVVQFIGDLYERRMLAPGFVQRVLKTLVGAGVGTSMVAIEQLRAVRLLLSHVQDSRLKSVDPNGMSEIMAAFFSSWVRINTSWMGEPFGRDELKTHFQYVENLVASWDTLPSYPPVETLVTRPLPTLPGTPLLASSPIFTPSSRFHRTSADGPRLARIVGLPRAIGVQA